MIKKHIMNNNNIINDEEKSEIIISEESLEDNKDQNEIINPNEFYKTTNSSNKIISRKEDIININPTFKETVVNFVNNKPNLQTNINSFKPPEIFKRRVSEIKYDIKTKSLKKVTYDITNEDMVFPRIIKQIHSESVDNGTNLVIQNNPNENYINTNIDNSVTSESVNNNNNSKENEIKLKDNKDYIDNNSIIKERRDTINTQNEMEYINMTSRKESNISLNENSGKMSNLPSYRSSEKNIPNINRNNDAIIYNKYTFDKSPKLSDEDKYLLVNHKKGNKYLNISLTNNKNNLNGNMNYNYANNHNNSNIKQLFLSERDFPQGINLVGLNDEKLTRKNSITGNTYIEQERDNNLKLERLGIPSPNGQGPKKRKIKLQGISTDAPLKISAAFGRTAYTFINTNNNKKIYSIQTIKKKPENEKLDIYLGSNS